MTDRIPVIDVFAGCGGLSEGFAQLSQGSRFDISLALDSDHAATETHLLRSFFHQFSSGDVPSDYYDFSRGELSLGELYQRYPTQAEAARQRVVRWELGKPEYPDAELHSKIVRATAEHEDWVLVGGPPCQAYSIAGRARNRSKADYEAAKDHRHFLYKEYLKILHTHRPAVFVMENVTGLLNSKIDGRHIWHLMLEDLIDPSAALADEIDDKGKGRRFDGYRIYSLVTPDRGLDIFGVPQIDRDEYIVRCEDYGIPQNRHRVLLFGVRADIGIVPRCLTHCSKPIAASDVLADLPAVRSGLTKTEDSNDNWFQIVSSIPDSEWLHHFDGPKKIKDEIIRVSSKQLRRPRAGRGGRFVPRKNSKTPRYQSDWYTDDRLGGFCNHETKAHMKSDLHRYMFAACYAKMEKDNLRLAHFPPELLPKHENVKRNGSNSLANSHFADRFAVQHKDKPSRTIVSHIAKDGHYYIHYDASQCRSLTVREAARLQTFPDNFYFLGNRTAQYKQVGNAVPPLLSSQVAEIVEDVLERAGLAP